MLFFNNIFEKAPNAEGYEEGNVGSQDIEMVLNAEGLREGMWVTWV